MTRDKGPDLLVAAAKLARTPLELDIVGAGVELGRIREQAGPFADRVRVHGEVSREELLRILSRADVAVNPHRMNPDRLGQIFPFKMVDYIGAGLPVVTSRLGEFPLQDKDSLVVYEQDTATCLAEAIERASNSRAPLRDAAARAREWVAAEYSSAAAARKAEAVFEVARAATGARYPTR
jgi:glycosyltransferase involved in cell wall biosynthesis